MHFDFSKIKNTNALNNWEDLRYFLVLAHSKSLTRAAQVLCVAPATVARRVETFEQGLGVPLFIRRQTGYVLTDEGERMCQHAAPIEEAVLAFERKSQTQTEGLHEAGHVRIACSEIVALHCITPQLGEFARTYPSLRLDLVVGVDRVSLSRRDADLAVRFVPPDKKEEGDYICQFLSAIDFAVYRSCQLMPETPNWRDLPYINWTEAHAHLPMAKWLSHAFSEKPPVLASNSLSIQYQAACAGVGVALLPCFFANQDPQLARVDIKLPALSREVWLVLHRDLRQSAQIAVVRQFLMKIIKRLDEKSAKIET